MNWLVSDKDQACLICGGINQPSFPWLDTIRQDYPQVYSIGADRGAYSLIGELGSVDLALGDFDSVSQAEMVIIQGQARQVETFSSNKDDTDLQLALARGLAWRPSSDIFIYGASQGGRRLDQLLANVYMALEERFMSEAHRITFLDSHHVIKYLLPGQHTLPFWDWPEYLSFVSLTPVWDLAISGAKYELKRTSFQQGRAFVSNELLPGQACQVSFSQGLVMVLAVRQN